MLRDIFKEHKGHLIHKWDHYFDIYERHFERFKNKKIILLEIGVSKGGSLEMWQEYFGDRIEIIGIDINKECKKLETDKIKIFIGSQEDKIFLRDLKSKIPKVDILIDDGGHMMDQLRITFEELYDWVDENGIYLAEDLHTCYWREYEGGYKRKNSFMEYCKNLTDKLNSWHSRNLNLYVDDFTKSTYSICFYDSIVVFEKKKILYPSHSFSGLIDLDSIQHSPPKLKNRWRKFRNFFYKYTKIHLG